MIMLATRYFFWCWKLKNQSLKLMVFNFARNVRAVIVHLDELLALSSKLNVLITYSF